MKTVSHTIFLSGEDKLKFEFTVNRGKISKFVVQYYAWIETRWRTIIRIDNCHGRGHIHKYYLHTKEYWVLLGIEDNNKAFNQAKLLVKRNFLKFKENFLTPK